MRGKIYFTKYTLCSVKPDDSDDETVCPEVEGEIEEDDVDAATVEHLDVDGHKEAKDWIESQDGNDDQTV